MKNCWESTTQLTFLIHMIIGVFTYTPTKISLATLDGEIMDPEITVKLEMRDVLKVHHAET